MTMTEFLAITILSLMVALFGFYAFAPSLSVSSDRPAIEQPIVLSQTR